MKENRRKEAKIFSKWDEHEDEEEEPKMSHKTSFLMEKAPNNSISILL